MSIKSSDDEILISFLSKPTPQFNSLQKELLHKERVLMAKSHIVFNSIFNEIIKEFIEEEIEEHNIDDDTINLMKKRPRGSVSKYQKFAFLYFSQGI